MLLYLILLLINLIVSIHTTKDVFTENLYIKPLSTGHVYAHFEFKTLYNKKLISLNYGRSSFLNGSSQLTEHTMIYIFCFVVVAARKPL